MTAADNDDVKLHGRRFTASGRPGQSALMFHVERSGGMHMRRDTVAADDHALENAAPHIG